MRKTRITAALAFLLLLTGTAAAGQPYRSIEEIKTSAPDRWTASYQTPWREVSIDVKIRVPDVSRFPVICVTPARPVEEGKLADYKYVNRNRNGMLEANFHGEDSVPRDWKRKSSMVFEDGAVPDMLPENSSLSYEAATGFLYDEFQRLFGLGREDFSIRQTIVDSAFYRCSGSGKDIVWKERATDTGRYMFTFRQQFRGIPYQPALDCYDPQHWKLGSEKNIRDGRASARITDTAHFRIVSLLMEEAGLVHEDIPLLPFEKAKEAFEREIMAGRLRSVDSLELCYIPYADPKDGKTFWLLPAWYLKGGYTRDAEREFKPYSDQYSGEVIDDGVERAEVVFEAQRGKLLDYTAKNKNRRALPGIITWQDAP